MDHVLIVKLGAMGDVLRTTALLPDILAAHERTAITWVTRGESLDVLAGNPLVYRSIDVQRAVAALATRRFAAIYAFDADEEGLALARLAEAPIRRGYRANDDGLAVGVEAGGDDTLYRLGLSDSAKRSNSRSYLELLAAAAGLRWSGSRPTIALHDGAVDVLRRDFADLDAPIVGIAAAASSRWQHKRWTPHHLAGFVARLHQEGMSTILFGEGEDEVINRELAARFGRRVRAIASAGRVDRLFAAIAKVDVLITTDSLTMHAGWALQRPIVALFGPTSAAEIDLGPEDIKLTADLPCLACYLNRCSIEQHCMELLTPDVVFAALRARLAAKQSISRA